MSITLREGNKAPKKIEGKEEILPKGTNTPKVQEPAENKIVDKPQEISYNDSNKESGYVGFENVKPKSQNSKSLNGMSFLEASKNDSFLKNRYKFGPQFNEWLKKNHDAIKYSGDNTFNNIKNTMEKDVPRFMQDAPFNVDKNGLISSIVKWNLADKAGNKDLKDKAVKNTIGYMSEENQEEYLKDQQPLEDYVKASDDYDHQRGNFKTTEYSTSEPDEDVMKIQNLLVDLDYRNKYDEPIKVDGLAGTNTLYAADTLADEADTIASENLEPDNIPVAQTVDENENSQRDYAKATSVSRGGYSRERYSSNKSVLENIENPFIKPIYTSTDKSEIDYSNITFNKVYELSENLASQNSLTDSLLNFERRLDEGWGIEKYPKKEQKVTFIKRIARELGLPEDLALAVAQTESGMNQWKKDGSLNANKGGDYGMMQINKSAHPDVFNSKTMDIINNWKHNVIYGLMYLKACYNDAVGQRYTGDDLLKATYSNYNSNSCSAYTKPNHQAYGHVKNFWTAYNEKEWNN